MHIAYRPDRQVGGRIDHWAMPDETISRRFGDCEDFAILKKALLIDAGVPAKSMSIVVLKDTDRQLYHAVLAIKTNAGHLILDNVRNDVLFDHQIRHYRPLYSISAAGNKIYGYKSGASVALATAPLAEIAPGAGYQ